MVKFGIKGWVLLAFDRHFFSRVVSPGEQSYGVVGECSGVVSVVLLTFFADGLHFLNLLDFFAVTRNSW